MFSSDEIPALGDLDFQRLIPKLAAVAVLHHSPEPLALADLAERLQGLGARLPHGIRSLQRSLASNPDPIRVRSDGRLELDPDSSELWYAVCRLQEALRPQAPRPPRPSSPREALEGLRQEQEGLRARAREWRSAVIRAVPGPAGPVGGLLPLPEGPARFFGPADGEAFLQALAELDLVIGLDPRTLFEQGGIPTRNRHFVDLTPPSRSGRTARGRAPQPPTKLLAGLALHAEKDLAEGAREAVADDLRLLRTHYRFGLLHGWVPLNRGGRDERGVVAWNPGAEPNLEDLLQEALRSGLAADLVLAPPADLERPFAGARRVVPEEVLDGTLEFRDPAGARAGQCMGLEEILDVRLVPLPPGVVTLPPEARQRQRAHRLVSRAWDSADPGDSRRLVRKALEVDPECLDALIVQALDHPKAETRIARLEEAVRVGTRQVAQHLAEQVGEFWALVETRPFMRACHALMFEYRSAGRVEEAIHLARELLRLSRRDELGVRYVCWSWLLETGRDWEALRALRDGGEEPTALYLYARALAEFRVRGVEEARPWASRAVRANRAFAGLLLDPASLPMGNIEGFSPGSPEEALALWRLFGQAWQAGGGEAVQALLEVDRP